MFDHVQDLFEKRRKWLRIVDDRNVAESPQFVGLQRPRLLVESLPRDACDATLGFQQRSRERARDYA
ncbi:hypothetical protein [Paraburkholderia tropica]|uniref:hypothetical protein n=1 Tax=Paraburkholderia tropica TaxID=92647 RepID=UPI003D2C88CE